MSKFPMIFEHCPLCDHVDRVIEEAYQESGISTETPGGTRLSFEPMAVPINNPFASGQLLSTTMPAVMLSFDYCGHCGQRYMTRADLIRIPTDSLPGQPKINLS